MSEKSNSANIVQAKGYSDKAAEEITRAINALSIHGVLQVRQKNIFKIPGKLWKSCCLTPQVSIFQIEDTNLLFVPYTINGNCRLNCTSVNFSASVVHMARMRSEPATAIVSVFFSIPHSNSAVYRYVRAYGTVPFSSSIILLRFSQMICCNFFSCSIFNPETLLWF
jgi:hypothetical protein